MGLIQATQTLTVLEGLAERVERAWRDGGLDGVDGERDIGKFS
jgi:hypothetical protein